MGWFSAGDIVLAFIYVLLYSYLFFHLWTPSPPSHTLPVALQSWLTGHQDSSPIVFKDQSLSHEEYFFLKYHTCCGASPKSVKGGLRHLRGLDVQHNLMFEDFYKSDSCLNVEKTICLKQDLYHFVPWHFDGHHFSSQCEIFGWLVETPLWLDAFQARVRSSRSLQQQIKQPYPAKDRFVLKVLQLAH